MSKDSNSPEPASSFSKKVNKGAIWITAATVTSRALGAISAIILSNLLDPNDFGLMAFAMAIVTFSQGTTQTGFESALIQKQDKPEEYLNTAWTFEFIRYIILFLLIFLLAPLFSNFFKEPDSTIIIRIISFTFIFQGLRNIGVVYFRKNLDFKKQFIIEVVPLIINICLVIPLAFILRNVWALVWAGLANSMVSCLISYYMHPFRPKFDFNLGRAKILFSFGKWILGSAIVGMINDQGFTMFVGKLFGMTVLGFYNRAIVFSNLIFQQISEIVWKVGYPAYSQLQNDNDRFKNAYLKTLYILTFIGIPMAGGLYVLSNDFVHIFLTDKWLPIIPLIKILCILSVFNFISTPSSIVFQAMGRPQIGTKISLLGIFILIFTVYPFSQKWGINGTVSSLLLSSIITSPIISYFAIKLMKCTLMQFIKPVMISFVCTVLMVFSILIVKGMIVTEIDIFGFLLLIFSGVIMYVVYVMFFEKITDYGIIEIIKSIFKVK